MHNHDIEIPNEYLCPITLALMKDPVFAADGRTYERSAIEKWIRGGNQTSPMTGARLTHTNLTPNRSLKSAISEFKKKLPSLQKQYRLKQDALHAKNLQLEEYKRQHAKHDQQFGELQKKHEKAEIELDKMKRTIQEMQKHSPTLMPQQNISPSPLSLEALKREAGKNYALAKSAIFRGSNKEAINLLFLAKQCFKELKKSRINCDRMLEKIKNKLTELKPRIASGDSIQPVRSVLPRPSQSLTPSFGNSFQMAQRTLRAPTTQSLFMKSILLKNLNPSCIKTLKGYEYSGTVWSVCWSPSGKFVASGNGDCTVIIWDAKKGTVHHTLEGYSTDVNSVSWSPSGKFVASGSGDCTVIIWDAKKGTVHHTLNGHSTDVNSVSWSPCGKFIASGSSDKKVIIWDAERGTVVHILKGHYDGVSSVSWSPNGEFIASGSLDKTVIIWDVNKGTVVHTLKGHSDSVRSVSWSPSEKFVVSGSDDKTIKIWDAKKGTVVHILKGHSHYVSSVCWSPCGKFIASGSCDKTIRIWDVNKGTVVHTLKGHSHRVYSVCWSPCGKFIASGSWDDTVRIWKLI